MEPGEALKNEQPANPRRVLIVDDEEEMAAAIAERLVLRGLTAEATSDPGDALRRVAAQAYDVAVLDVKMPGMDGIQLMRKMRDAQPDLRVILISGYGSPNEREQGLEAGAFDCLVKPFDIQQLVLLIERSSGS